MSEYTAILRTAVTESPALYLPQCGQRDCNGRLILSTTWDAIGIIYPFWFDRLWAWLTNVPTPELIACWGIVIKREGDEP